MFVNKTKRERESVLCRVDVVCTFIRFHSVKINKTKGKALQNASGTDWRSARRRFILIDIQHSTPWKQLLFTCNQNESTAFIFECSTTIFQTFCFALSHFDTVLLLCTAILKVNTQIFWLKIYRMCFFILYMEYPACELLNSFLFEPLLGCCCCYLVKWIWKQ